MSQQIAETSLLPRLVSKETVTINGRDVEVSIPKVSVRVSEISERTEGAKTDPADTTVLADSGALSAGTYEIRALLGANTQTEVDVQHRNAANSGNIVAHRVYTGPNSGMYVFTMTLADGERVRVAMAAALTGHAAASLQTRVV
jgi:hypothetical protein